jgi:hypothetical protein
MRLIEVIITIVVTVVIVYVIELTLGTAMDSMAFTLAGVPVYGHPEWAADALGMFKYFHIAIIGILVATLIWGFRKLFEDAEYTRGV